MKRNEFIIDEVLTSQEIRDLTKKRFREHNVITELDFTIREIIKPKFKQSIKNGNKDQATFYSQFLRKEVINTVTGLPNASECHPLLLMIRSNETEFNGKTIITLYTKKFFETLLLGSLEAKKPDSELLNQYYKLYGNAE